MSVNNRTIRVGDVIKVVNHPNKDNLLYPFYGINKDKEFMPTVANTEGLDGSKYTLLEKGMFVFSGMQTGRDICIRIGFYDNDTPVLISPAYITFVITDENVILPQYFFLFFKRYEMDRYGAFLSDSSIRSNLDWDRFCEIQIPLPTIETQRELVAVYNGLKTLAEENEALLKPLSDACQAFIVDCKKQYSIEALGDLIEMTDIRNDENHYKETDVRGISTNKELIDTKANLAGVSLSSYKVINPTEFVYVADTSRRGDKIALAYNNSGVSYLVSSIYTTFKVKTNELIPEYLFIMLNRPEFDRYARFNSWGSARETFDWSEMCRTQIPLPPKDVQESIVNLYRCYEEAKLIASQAREQLKTICPALIQKAAHSS